MLDWYELNINKRERERGERLLFFCWLEVMYIVFNSL